MTDQTGLKRAIDLTYRSCSDSFQEILTNSGYSLDWNKQFTASLCREFEEFEAFSTEALTGN